jgi:acyl-coenzyme A thioesterase PaaI-like protein
MNALPFQDKYLEARADCWGCGRKNPDGLYIKSFWQDHEAVAHFQPQPNQMGHKGLVNGGILATLVDCHSIGLAMAHAHKEEGREIGTLPLITYVTASLTVNYLKPTPLNQEPLEVRAHIKKTDGRKTFVECSVYADGIETVKADVLGLRIEEAPQVAN